MYVRGKIVERSNLYYIVTVGFTGNSPIGDKMHVKLTGISRQGRQEVVK